MNLKKITLSLAATATAFVLLGDRVLPSPANAYSFQARTSISKLLFGLLPQLKPQKPNAQTEQAVDSLKP
jgi:hypothetical protein